MEVEQSQSSLPSIVSPLDLVKLSLDEVVRCVLKGERTVVGKLHAYDQHLNMVLADVEETLATIEEDEDTGEEITTVRHPTRTKRKMEMLFIRGDAVILVSPPGKA